MKGLLHSKRLRKNLYKWLFMYVGTILLLTTVVTYSKYVSTLMSDGDSARVAKFDFKLTDDCKENECSEGKVRPTKDLTYYFKLDTTNLEVSTKFTMILFVNDNFTFKLYDVSDGEVEQALSDVTVSNEDRPTSSEKFNAKSWNFNIKAGSNTIKKYKLVVKYNKTFTEGYTEINDIVRLNYKAEQINKE